MSDSEIEALATYGTLAPGESNHWVVSRIIGEWVEGRVRGYQFEITWGPAEGYQGFLPDDDAGEIRVSVLRSAQLPKSWREIDDFEGPGYERQSIAVLMETDDGPEEIQAQIYVALTEVE